MRARVAYLSPVPPARTGVAEHAAAVLPELARRLDVEVFSDLRPGDEPRVGALRVEHVVRFLARAGSFDAAVHQIGNSEPHRAILEALFHAPGVVELHDTGLHHLRLRHTHGAARGREYARRLEEEHGRAGRALAAAVRKNLGGSLGYFLLPMRARVLDAAVGVVVHGEAARRALRAERPCLPILALELPVAVPPVPDVATRAFRRRAGAGGGTMLVVSPGLATPAKRIGRLAAGVAAARAAGADVRLAVAGAVEPGSGIEEAVERAGLSDALFTGRLPEAEYFAALAAADVVACLRFPSAGESSLPAAQAMALGKPLLVSAAGSFLEIDRRACVRVPVGGAEEASIAAALRRLAASPEERAALGAASRAAAAARPTPERFARALAAFVTALLPLSRARLAAAAERIADAERRAVASAWRLAAGGFPAETEAELREIAGVDALAASRSVR